MDIGRLGIWTFSLRGKEPGAVAEAAAELEELGYGAVWLPGGVGGRDVFDDIRRILDGTTRLVAATGIVSIWASTADEVVREHRALTDAHPGRFLNGLGVSHSLLVDQQEAGRYRRPFSRMVAFLDDLGDRVPRDELCLAALGPKMLRLAAERTAGAHPYNVTPEHTAVAREVMGPGPLVATEVAVAVTKDATEARASGRQHLAIYLALPNYTNNLRRFGFGDDDFADGGSDRLVDALVAWGTVDQIGERVREHHEAGADHVCLQVVGGEFGRLARDEWRELAALA